MLESLLKICMFAKLRYKKKIPIMSLKKKVDDAIKEAMKAQDKDRLRALRAIKSAILLAETKEGKIGELTEAEELQLLMKASKQRKDSAQIYEQQGRADLLAVEEAELAVLEEFLPKMLSADELKAEISAIIAKVGASSPKDMGKVMGVASKELAGKAEGRQISEMVKALLS